MTALIEPFPDLNVAAVRTALENLPGNNESLRQLIERLLADNLISCAAINNLSARHFGLEERVTALEKKRTTQVKIA